jgi:hypothetical protein
MERLIEIVGKPDRLGEMLQPKEAFDLTLRSLQIARRIKPLVRCHVPVHSLTIFFFGPQGTTFGTFTDSLAGMI